MLDCEICGKPTEIRPVYCCDGYECNCRHEPINENVICDECKEKEEGEEL